MSRRALARVAASILALFLAGGAGAANTLTISPPASASFSNNLSGLDQTGTYSMSVPVSYTSIGSNKNATLGWHITATSTTLKGGTTARTLATTASRFTSITDSVGCTVAPCTDAPSNGTITYPVTIPAATVAPAAVSVFSTAAGNGTGGNTLTMQVSVSIPANTYADTYSSTLTLASIEGP